MDNVPEVLLRYRLHEESVTARRRTASRKRLLKVLSEGLREIGVDCSREELLFHAEVGNGSGMHGREEVLRADRWLDRLGEANGKKGVHTGSGLYRAAGMAWFRLCRNSSQLGPWVWTAWRNGCVRPGYEPSRGERATFLGSIARCMLPGEGGGFPQGRMNITEEVEER